MVTIKRISRDDPLYAGECSLRERVLLGPIGYDMDRFRREFPYEERFEHFVAVIDHPAGPTVVGCAVLLVQEQDGRRVGKLMQMAVDPQRQGEGIGRRIVVEIERRAFAELDLDELYCHARDSAYGFYARMGWAFDSDEFEEACITHRRMAFRPGPGPNAGDSTGEPAGDDHAGGA